ncbi:MAG: hypothetical protein PHI98_12705, partial [Eubacteriales bacterium]|nr:hypothetical protein [Eubacteriales bacterium]
EAWVKGAALVRIPKGETLWGSKGRKPAPCSKAKARVKGAALVRIPKGETLWGGSCCFKNDDVVLCLMYILEEAFYELRHPIV